MSVFTEVQAEIVALPSSSLGQIKRGSASMVVERAIVEFRHRVKEMFGS